MDIITRLALARVATAQAKSCPACELLAAPEGETPELADSIYFASAFDSRPHHARAEVAAEAFWMLANAHIVFQHAPAFADELEELVEVLEASDRVRIVGNALVYGKLAPPSAPAPSAPAPYPSIGGDGGYAAWRHEQRLRARGG